MLRLTSATGSRSVRNTVPVRRLSWVTCPSTHTRPSLFTHSAIERATVRTGSGCSAEFGSGIRRPYEGGRPGRTSSR
jgi:hypothetical protein